MAMTKPLLAAEARLAKLVINRNSMTSRGISTPLRFMAFLLTAIYVVRKPFVPRGKHSRFTGNLKLSWARSPSVVSEARAGKAHARARCVCALSIQRLEGSRPRLRRTRALCKFNGVKEQRRTAPRLCGKARHVTV